MKTLVEIGQELVNKIGKLTEQLSICRKDIELYQRVTALETTESFLKKLLVGTSGVAGAGLLGHVLHFII